ncbi:MAG TPA: hypothetical protein GXX14_11250 [Clostridiaceae bacterium]|nr:hypothetical protein [Clostridiaceae bacterium]
MKKALVILLTVVFLFAIVAGCSSKQSGTSDSAKETDSSSQTSESQTNET